MSEQLLYYRAAASGESRPYATLARIPEGLMLERSIEKLLFASRWLLAPMYLGLSLALIALGVKFFMEIGHSLTHILEIAETDLVLSVLSLIDLALVGSLLVMVMLSGYENFISKIDATTEQETPEWLGKLDSGT